MARTATTGNGKLWVWDDGDNPGAGAKGITKTAGGTGINANFEELDVAVFTEHNSDGTHKDSAITGVKLKQSGAGAVADGATLEFSSNQIRIKDAGITSSKIATNAIATSNLQDDSVDASKLRDDASVDVNRAVTTHHIRDLAITTNKIALRAVTSEKLSEDLGWQQIFGDLRIAGSSAGSTPAAITEWTETSSTPVVKFSFFMPTLKQGATRYLRIRGNIKTDNASKAWTIQLTNTAGGVLASQTSSNTSYDSSPELNLAYQIVDGSSEANVEFQLRMMVASGGTVNMKNLDIFVTPTIPIVS